MSAVSPEKLKKPSLKSGDSLTPIHVSVAVLAVLLCWFGWSMAVAGSAVHRAAENAIAIAELRGHITYLDEYLTMSARMAAQSGDERWRDRFKEKAPELDTAITAAARLAKPKARATLDATLIEPQRDIAQMQRRAMSLAASRNLAEAQALLNGAEFGYLEDVYRGGLEGFGQDLKADAEIEAAEINAEARLRAIGFGVTAILLATALMAGRHRVRLRAARCIDPLTQVPNRRQFYALLGTALGRSGPSDTNSRELIVIGVDHFKAVNDSYGHAVADRLLQLVASRLQAAVPTGSVLARVGGDEFALLVESKGRPDECPGRRMLAAITEPYRLAEVGDVALAFSAGLVRIGEGAEAGDVMRQAGIALQQAKADGRNCLRVFDHALDVIARDRSRLESDLRLAVEGGEIVPFYQPLVDLMSGEVIGVETLARWYHAGRGWVSPAQFIPLAEDLGLIDGLMERLLRQACAEALHWPPHVTVAFNVSPLQLRNEALPGRIRAILAETGFPARRLEVEVTESALVQDLALARTLLEDLRHGGVRLALDDFGTGYSSLKHLRCLPFDKIKIDASFVGGMVDDRESAKIVAAVVGLGHSLGLSTVAEGVETRQVADLLRDLGCDIGQGWLFGRPMPAADLIPLLAVPGASTAVAA